MSYNDDKYKWLNGMTSEDSNIPDMEKALYGAPISDIPQDQRYETLLREGNLDLDKADVSFLTDTMLLPEAGALYEEDSGETLVEKPVGTILSDDFTSWADPTVPDGWSKGGEYDAANYVEQHSDGIRIVSDGSYVDIAVNILTPGKLYTVVIDVAELNAGTLALNYGSSEIHFDAVGVQSASFTADLANLALKRRAGVGPVDAVVRSITVKEAGGEPVGLILDQGQMGGKSPQAYIAGLPNLWPNPSFSGAQVGVVGSGGALPDGVVSPEVLAVTEILGVGETDGIQWMRLRLTLDNTSGSTRYPRIEQAEEYWAAASVNEVWRSSFWLDIESTTHALQHQLVEDDSGTYLSATTQAVAQTTGRDTVTRRLQQPDVNRVRNNILAIVPDGESFEAVFKIGMPRLTNWGKHAYEKVEAFRPEYRVVNGIEYLRLDGVDDSFELPFPDDQGPASVSIFMPIRTDASQFALATDWEVAAEKYCYIGLGEVGNTAGAVNNTVGGSASIHVNNSPAITTRDSFQSAAATGEWVIVEVRLVNLSFWRRMHFHNLDGWYAEIDRGAILIVPTSNITDDTRTLIMNWLAEKYGVDL